MKRVAIILAVALHTCEGASCPPPEKTPEIPKNLMDYSGITWPEMCFNDTEEQHFFVIGDWGGVFPHNTFQNLKGRPANPDVDPNAQVLTSQAMASHAATVKPKFVLNVGDNIYPGGIGGEGQCNPAEGAFDSQGQSGIVMANTFEGVYTGTGLEGVEWWGTLGNHDYGGYYYSCHWDQMLYYTWHSNESRWITPALYWTRRVQYNGFKADFYFIDSNINDVKDPSVDVNHNICNNVHNHPNISCPGTSITSPETCVEWFNKLWDEQKQWLEDKLNASDADWQIIVTHYPPAWDPAQIFWHQLFPKYGVDLFVSGHTHWQKMMYKADDFGDTAYIVSGGGGGITSEILPDSNGQDDAYGFVDVTISKEQLDVKMYSHKLVLRNHTIVKPRQRQSKLVV